MRGQRVRAREDRDASRGRRAGCGGRRGRGRGGSHAARGHEERVGLDRREVALDRIHVHGDGGERLAPRFEYVEAWTERGRVGDTAIGRPLRLDRGLRCIALRAAHQDRGAGGRQESRDRRLTHLERAGRRRLGSSRRVGDEAPHERNERARVR